MTTQTETADVPLATTLERFFEVKTSADVEGTMAFFSPDLVAYVDSTLSWDFAGYAALKQVFAEYMPTWTPPARSYPAKILAGEHSALVHMVDTPELFGGELRIVAAVDVVAGRVVRWVDYWDSSTYDTDLYERLRTPGRPRELTDSEVASRVAPELASVVRSLHEALTAGDAAAVASLMHADATFVDMALRTTQIGRLQTTRYLERVLHRAPYGAGVTLRNVVGGARGGGWEWTSPDGLVGITAVELDDRGLIMSLTSTYDSRKVDPALSRALHEAALG